MTALEAVRAEAQRLLQAGQAAAAEVVLRSLPAPPEDPAVLALLAASVAAQQRPADAETLARSAVAAGPDHAPYHALLGAILEAAGRHSEAVAALDRAVTLAPDDARLRLRLAKLHRRMDRIDEAARHYSAAAQLQPQVAEIHFNLGNVLRHLTRHDEGIAAYRRAIALKPAFLEAHMNLGNALYAKGDLDGARAAYEMAVTLGGGGPAAHKRLGEIHAQQNAFELAEAAFRAAIARQPDDPALHLALADVVARQGRREEAAELTRHADRTTAHRILPLDSLDHLAATPRQPTGGRPLVAVMLDDAVVVNREWFIAHGRRLYPNLVTDLDLGAVRGVHFLDHAPAALISAEWPTRFSAEPLLLLGGGGNYYHWLLDVLPRLRIVDDHPGLGALPLLAGPGLSPFQLQSLAHIGIGTGQLRRFPPSTLIRCRHLVVPLQVGRPFRSNGVPDWQKSTVTAEALDWLRGRVLGREPVSGHRRLFLSRRDARTRGCVNEAEIQAVARTAGYEIIAPGELPFREQAELFASASHVAGIHGAGLANLAFAPRGCIVTELASTAQTPHFFSALAELLGHRHSLLLGHLVERDPERGTHHASFALDPTAVEAALS